MSNYTRKLAVVVTMAVMFFAAACSTEDNAGANPAPDPTIADIVNQDNNFSTLRAALVRADLLSALSGPNLTLFAPDNTAFVASGITDISAVPVPTLQSLLRYHVVGRQIPSSAIPGSDTIKTLNSQNLYASFNTNGKFINGAPFRRTDVKGSNGYIHVMSFVLNPPAPNKSIASVVANDTTFSFLFQAIGRVNKLALFNDPNKLTVFAPTNAAFRAAGITNVNTVPVATLDLILQQHVIVSSFFSSDLVDGGTLPTSRGGTNLIFGVNRPGGVFTTRVVGSTNPVSQITAANNVCTNGVIHVINRVLL